MTEILITCIVVSLACKVTMITCIILNVHKRNKSQSQLDRERNDRIITALVRSNQEAELMTAAENRSKPMSLKREIVVVVLANIAIYCFGLPRRIKSAAFSKAKRMIEDKS